MAIRTIDDTSLSNIADMIRLRLNTDDTYRPDQMAEAISHISGMTEYWKGMGFTDTPSDVSVGYSAAQTIMDNWDASIANRDEAYQNDDNLVYFPGVDMSAVTSMNSMFKGCDSLRAASLKETGSVTSMNYAFQDCSKLVGIDPEVDFSSVVYARNLLTNCPRWTADINWEMPECTTLEEAFSWLGSGSDGNRTAGTYTITLDIPKVANLGSAFAMADYTGRYPLTEVHLTTTSALVWLRNTFANNFNLTDITISNTSGVVGDGWIDAFNNCSSLVNISQLDMRGAGGLNRVFKNCSSLVSIDILTDGAPIYNASSMFENCQALEDVPVIDLSNFGIQQYGTDRLSNMFYNCTSLTDESLNNILESCINSGITGSPALSTLGFNSTDYPTSRIQALDKYADFISAGWSIGYS